VCLKKKLPPEDGGYNSGRGNHLICSGNELGVEIAGQFLGFFFSKKQGDFLKHPARQRDIYNFTLPVYISS